MGGLGSKTYLIIIFFVILAFVAGIVVDRTFTSLTAQKLPIPKAEPLIQRQSASISGEITQVEGRIITVKNGEKMGSYQVADRVTIYKTPAGETKLATPSSELSQIELNKPAVLTLEYKDDSYKVTSISYLTTPPPPPTAPKK